MVMNERKRTAMTAQQAKMFGEEFISVVSAGSSEEAVTLLRKGECETDIEGKQEK